MKFLSLTPLAFGLDISDHSLKIANLQKKRGGLRLTSWGEVSVPPEIIEEGQVKKKKELVQIIKSGLSEVQGRRLKTKEVVASLPEEKSFLEVIRMPQMEPSKVQEAVKFEAENYIPLPVEEVYLGSQIIPPVQNQKDYLEVLISALPQKVVDSYLSVLQEAGLQPVALENESLAICRALIEKSKTRVPVLLVDLGATKTTFVAFSGYSPRFTYSIPVSSEGLSEALSKNLGVSPKKAEKMKLKYGLRRKTATQKKVFDALIPSLVDLSEQLKKYLDYYKTHASSKHLPPDGKKIKKILLCGGGANLWGIAPFLSNQLQATVEIGNPWVNISKSQKPPSKMDPKKSLIYTAALGLALKGARGEF